MPKPRTGHLIRRKKGYFVRLTMNVEGEHEPIQKCVDLETDNIVIARRRQKQLAKQHALNAPTAEATQHFDTYAEAADRVFDERERAGVRGVRHERDRDVIYVRPAIGPMDVRDVRASHIKAILDDAAADGKSQGTLKHIRAAANAVFDALWRDEVIPDNPVARVKVPKGKRDKRERAVLTDAELAIYLRWQHPTERFRKGVLERQTMSIVARTFGGLRTGDLHALRWDEHFDTKDGGFTHGMAPRRKTASPQKLEIPEMLRPFLRRWWQAHGEPTRGLVFPSLRGAGAGKGSKHGVSHAAAFRRDLQRAFKAADAAGVANAPDADSARWLELFAEADHPTHKPVDFHSWRRSYAQALADAGVNAQTAAKLTGQTVAIHETYLTRSTKARVMPTAALPDLSISASSLQIRSENAADGGDNFTGTFALDTSEITADFDDAVARHAMLDSNQRPSAPEADALSS